MKSEQKNEYAESKKFATLNKISNSKMKEKNKRGRLRTLRK